MLPPGVGYAAAMAEQPFLSRRQRGIVNTYYANADTALSQRATELVSDLALAAGDEGKVSRLWVQASEILARSSVDGARCKRIVESRDLEALARLAPTLKGAGRGTGPR